MRRVDSSSIAELDYDFRTQVLLLKFRGGGAYKYFAVPPQVYHELIAAESKGRFVNYFIKDHYRCQRVTAH